MAGSLWISFTTYMDVSRLLFPLASVGIAATSLPATVISLFKGMSRSESLTRLIWASFALGRRVNLQPFAALADRCREPVFRCF